MKILFVDDDEFNRIVIHDMLEVLFEGTVIDTYESAEDVLDADIESYDIIISDITMPGMDGLMLCDKLRGDCNYKKPIIAATALAVMGDKEKILMRGFDDYVSKPIDMDELEKVIKKYI